MLREFDEQAQKAIVVAESLSFDFGHQNVGSEHLLLSLLKIHDNQLKRLLQKYDVNDAVVEEDIKRLFGTNDDQPFYMEYSVTIRMSSVVPIVTRRYDRRSGVLKWRTRMPSSRRSC